MLPFTLDLFERFDSTVQAGPFKGMKLRPKAPWDSWAVGSMLLGDYEKDIQPSVEQAINRNPRTVINVGCAGGYYAVGFARRLPDVSVVAFDTMLEALQETHALATLNGVAERVGRLKGATKPDTIRPITPGPYLYFLDCEGAEFKLLDPKSVPELVNADFIVECHDFMDDSWTWEGLFLRFALTHHVGRVVPPHNGNPLFEFRCNWPGYVQSQVMTDARPKGASWMVAWAKEYK